jgi:hypothetical protein
MGLVAAPACRSAKSTDSKHVRPCRGINRATGGKPLAITHRRRTVMKRVAMMVGLLTVLAWSAVAHAAGGVPG